MTGLTATIIVYAASLALITGYGLCQWLALRRAPRRGVTGS